MTPDSFTGDRKAPMRSPLADLEHRLIEAWAPRFPRWIEGYHLTLLTIPWTLGLLAAGWLGRQSLQWLWLSSAMLFLQWFTDSFDGKLGRLRDTGHPALGLLHGPLSGFPVHERGLPGLCAVARAPPRPFRWFC